MGLVTSYLAICNLMALAINGDSKPNGYNEEDECQPPYHLPGDLGLSIYFWWKNVDILSY